MTMKIRASAIVAGLAAVSVLTLSSVGFADVSPTPTPSNTELANEVNDESKVQPYVQPGVVFVTVKWQAWLKDNRYQGYFNDGQPVTLRASCTGYVVNPAGWIATAGHCVSVKEIQKDYLDVAVNMTIREAFYDTNNRSVIRATLLDHLKTESSDDTGATGKPDREVTVSWGASVSGIEVQDNKPARVVAWQELEQGDGALLKVDEQEMNALLLVPGDETVDTLTQVASFGFPGSVDDVTDNDYNPSIKTGTVSSQKTIGDGLIPVYEISADVSPGMSGGPTVNYNGEVIGTNSFFPANETQSFNFVGTSERVLELMASNGVANEQSEDTLAFRKGIDAYFDGDKDTAVDALTLVVEAQPANELARDYLQRAQDLPDEAATKDDNGFPIWIVFVLFALVLVALAVVSVVMLSRKQKTATTQPMLSKMHDIPLDDYCPSCGEPLKEQQRFCGHCGTSFI